MIKNWYIPMVYASFAFSAGCFSFSGVDEMERIEVGFGSSLLTPRLGVYMADP
jgi:hypothetical protein